MQNNTNEEEFIIDSESGEETDEDGVLDAAAFKSKLLKLKKKLVACETERMDNLAGWQRAKADLANYRRQVSEDRERERVRATEDIVTDLLSVVDSFSMAMQDSAWNNVDKNWRTGVESIHAQLSRVLKDHGVASYGASGEAFDPTLHESVSISSTQTKKDDHTISQVIQPGYLLHGRVIRPAKVVVAMFSESN